MDNDDLPDFLRISQAARNAAWEKNPPKSMPAFFDPRLEADREQREAAKKEAARIRIAKMKASLDAKNKKPEKVDVTGMRWNVNRSRWEQPQEKTMSLDQVKTYNELVAQAQALGLKNIAPTSRFKNKAAGDRRIKDLQDMIAAKTPTLIVEDVPTDSSLSEPVAIIESGKTEEAPVAKKAKKTKAKARNGAAKSNGGIKPGSKLEIFANLMKRKNGCTEPECAKAMGWAKVNMSMRAKDAGLKMRKERGEDGVTRYWGE